MLSKEYRLVAEAINACKNVNPQIMHGQLMIEVLKRKMKRRSRFDYKEVITLQEYQGFQRAYDFFNSELFAGSLPQVLVTLQRHANSRGYFSPQRFKGRVEKVSAHELALNPDTFTGRTDAMILSTLVHEMCHVWQETYGEPSRRGYHNQQWAAKMREVGLQPTDTGQEGGAETGQAVTHYILPEGRYARAYAKLAATGLQLNWQSLPAMGQGKGKISSKTKFTCPGCGQNAWGKPSARLICGRCFKNGEGGICYMVSVQEV